MPAKSLKNTRICIVGLGYVGLPLAVEFGKTGLKVFGFDINVQKIQELKKGFDSMAEISKKELKSTKIEYSADPAVVKKANFIIVAVPTPIDKAKRPDLTLVEKASKTVGENLAKGSIVVFESTVYPGVTEEICIPLIEKYSGLKCGKDWKIGYSPERVNPGDKAHTIDKIVKVVSGMDPESLEKIAQVYSLVCKAGIHKTPNIKTAEAAKVIENVQRDLNIALVNELALIFNRMGINTQEVLEAAATKWNFHQYQPGLVGGHCIGIDPYYLTHRAEELGYHPQVILAGRHVNDSMGEYIADLMIQGLVEAGKVVQGARVLVMGLTFKQDIRDIRNSKIHNTIKKLQSYGVHVLGHDPNLYEEEVKKFGVEYVSDLAAMGKVDGIILATLHKQFKAMTLDDLVQYYNGNGDGRGVFVDIKSWFLPSFTAAKPHLFPIIYKCL